MIFRTIAVGVLLAFAVNSFALGSSHVSRKDNPVAQPKFPKIPKDPTIPTIPGFPDPGKLPKLPPPGTNPKGGPEVPFPLSTTLPFPWGAIEGTWRVIADNVNIFFSFSVQTDTNGHQYLRAVQLDKFGQVLATGVGISVETDKLVRAAMTAKSVGVNYMLFIGSYKNTGAYSMGTDHAITVLTVRPFTSIMGADDVQVVVQKISNSPMTEETYDCQL